VSSSPLNPTPKRIRILVVDDHPIVREGVIRVMSREPDMEVIGEAGDGEEALAQARRLRPNLILMNVHMPGCNGIRATASILAEMPRVKVIMLSASNCERDLFHAIEAGASGYLLKNLPPAVLVDKTRGLFQGEAPISRLDAARIMREFARRANGERTRLKELSQREVQVLRLAAQGCANQEIAHRLGIALHTVKNHIRNILNKLDVDNRVQAVALAAREGLLDAEEMPARVPQRRQ